MTRNFICLANSRKYNERCIAGIELKNDKNSTYKVVRDKGQPVWIRPVSKRDHGEVSENQVSNIKICDIVEIEITEPCPRGFQSENVHYSNLKKLGSLGFNNSNLSLLIDRTHSKLFGNKGKAVSKEVIHEVDYSLLLIKPDSFEIKKEQHGIQLRGIFRYKGFKYDLPITDLSFLDKYPNIQINPLNLYLTISLGCEFHGWHYKLIAGIIITKEKAL